MNCNPNSFICVFPNPNVVLVDTIKHCYTSSQKIELNLDIFQGFFYKNEAFSEHNIKVAVLN